MKYVKFHIGVKVHQKAMNFKAVHFTNKNSILFNRFFHRSLHFLRKHGDWGKDARAKGDAAFTLYAARGYSYISSLYAVGTRRTKIRWMRKYLSHLLCMYQGSGYL